MIRGGAENSGRGKKEEGNPRRLEERNEKAKKERKEWEILDKTKMQVEGTSRTFLLS